MKNSVLKYSISLMMFASPILVTTTALQAKTTVSQAQATKNLTTQLSGIRGMTANFTQTTAAPAAKTNQRRAQHLNKQFSGTMQVARPGKFYWQTTKPAKQTIVANGNTVLIYDPDLKQAVRQKLDQQVSNTPALLLSGQASEIMKSYRVVQPNPKKTYYTLYPKANDGVFQNLTISFGTNKAPNLMILNDSMGQSTTIRFSNVKVNPSLNQSLFSFKPPKGTDIINQ